MKSSIARKLAMALSALFLMFFLLQHLTINALSLFGAEMFNEVSHFMGSNPLVQFLLQPILIFAVVFHFVMGFILELKNNASREVKYSVYNGSAGATWMSRNMIWTGLAVLGFIGLHFYDFWLPEMDYKYISVNPEDPTRYYEELRHKFVDIWRVVLYVIAFVFLGLHLNHGFQSAFQSIGFRNRFTPIITKLGTAYSILVPFGFVFIAVYHYLTH